MKKKVIVGALILLSVIAIVLCKLIPKHVGDYLFDIYVVTIMFVTSTEIFGIKIATSKKPNKIMTFCYPVYFYIVALILVRFSMPLYFGVIIELLALVAYGLVSWIVILIMKQDKSFNKTIDTLEACLYPSFLIGLFLLINHADILSGMPYFSIIFIVLAFAIAMITDTLAMFVGMIFRGPKLAPNISPNKTISGAIGGLIGGILGALIVYGTCCAFPNLSAVFTVYGIQAYHFALLGFVGSILGQAGDLYESYLKRRAGVKDAGNFFPGHGGMMDRVDALTFVITFVFVYLMIILV